MSLIYKSSYASLFKNKYKGLDYQSSKARGLYVLNMSTYGYGYSKTVYSENYIN